MIGEGHFGKVLLVRWKNDTFAGSLKNSLTETSSSTTLPVHPRLAEEGKGDGHVAASTVVRQNRHRDNGDGVRLLAVKEVALHKDTSLPGVLNERQILGVLEEHPFVVTLRCAWRSGNFLYYGLDFLAGADLFEVFRRNAIKMDVRAARVYGGQMALALEHLHAHGICYRDLKVRRLICFRS